MIYITGDTHGEFERFGSHYFDAAKGDYVIICGDFGNLWDNSNTEKYWRKWLKEKPFTVLFIDGNHENYDMLSAFPITEWNGGKIQKIADNIIHLMRGQVFDIDGIRFFTMGGASSHDIDAGVLEPSDPDFTIKRKKLDREMALYRINRVSWWAEELPSEEEMAEGLANLERVGNKDRLTDYLDIVKEKCEFKMWFFGHYHENRIIGQRFTMLYKEKIRLDDWLEQV